MNRRMLLSGMLTLPVAACSQAYSDLPVATAGTGDRYTLGPGDSIKVSMNPMKDGTAMGNLKSVAKGTTAFTFGGAG